MYTLCKRARTITIDNAPIFRPRLCAENNGPKLTTGEHLTVRNYGYYYVFHRVYLKHIKVVKNTCLALIPSKTQDQRNFKKLFQGVSCNNQLIIFMIICKRSMFQKHLKFTKLGKINASNTRNVIFFLQKFRFIIIIQRNYGGSIAVSPVAEVPYGAPTHPGKYV